MDNNSFSVDYKSDEKANRFREEGNYEFSMDKYICALILYNKSIIYASTKKVLALGYANRSAVYLQLELYDECLMNIELARQNDYPADKIDKLNERELKCKNLKFKGRHKKNPDPWEFFKLSYLANKKIPWIVDCLELQTTKKYGRGIYATKNLKPGDIICIEKPAIHLLDRAEYFKHCSNCYKTSMMNLIPCNQTASMMFCSTDCMEDFYSKSIDIELSLDDDMKILSEIAAPFGGYKELDEFITKTNLKDLKKTIFDYDFSNPEDPDYRKNLMTCFLSLQPKENHQINEGSRCIYDFVSKKTANHILGITSLNSKFNYFREQKFGIPFFKGRVIPLFLSLINHSCINNLIYISIDNKTVVYVTKSVRAGEQLFICYYDNHNRNYFLFKNQLMQEFGFKCDCEECANMSFRCFEPRIIFPYTFMNRKDFNKARKMLYDGINYLKTGNDPREICDREIQIYMILTTLAFFATFPG